MSVDSCAECVWFELEDDYNLDSVDSYCQEFSKFIAWLEYVCVEYLAQEVIASYKQRLLNFE